MSDEPLPLRPACCVCGCSRWIVAQQKGPGGPAEEGQEEAERAPSYADEAAGVLGCEHYRRNCKLKAACCNRLVACRFCHDRVSDHAMERRDTTEMMCMHCLTLQPIAQHCANAACPNPLMAKYYCSICKMLDDSRYARWLLLPSSRVAGQCEGGCDRYLARPVLRRCRWGVERPRG